MVKILEVLATNHGKKSKRAAKRSKRGGAQSPPSQGLVSIPAGVITTSSGVVTAPSRRGRGRARDRPRLRGATLAWLKTLGDPFEFPGVRTGFGCMAPTGLQAMYARGSFSANADGSFSVGAHSGACTSGFAFTSSAGATTSPSWTGITATGATALTGSYSIGRVVSFGLRVRVLQAMTAAPGVMAGAYIPVLDSQNAFGITVTPTNMLTIANTHLAYGNETMQVLWRPRGPEDFIFYPLNNPTGVCISSGDLCVQGTGFPASATVFYEAVCHIEAQASTQSGSADVSDTGVGWIQTAFNTLSEAANLMSSLPPEVTSTIQSVFGFNSPSVRGLRGVYRSTNPGFSIQEMKEF